jgi:hypothetical protein
LRSGPLPSAFPWELWVEAGIDWSAERHEATARESTQRGRHAFFAGLATRRREFRDDLATVRHLDALTGTHLPEVLAQAILQVADTYSLHVVECSVT